MSRRFRWFTVGGERFSVHALGTCVLADEYDERKRSGFVVDERSRARVSGTFIEKLDLEEEIEDPFGRIMRYKRVEYRRLRFSCCGEDHANLELEDPPRASGAFFARIGMFLDQGIHVEPVRPDVMKWIRALEKDVTRVQISSISVSDAPLSASARADVIITGTGDVRRDLSTFLDGKGTVAAADVTWRVRESDDRLSCELTRAGANVPEHWTDAQVRPLRTSLRAQFR